MPPAVSNNRTVNTVSLTRNDSTSFTKVQDCTVELTLLKIKFRYDFVYRQSHFRQTSCTGPKSVKALIYDRHLLRGYGNCIEAGVRTSALSIAARIAAHEERARRFLPWTVGVFVLIGTLSWMQRAGDFAGYLTVGELALAGEHIYGSSTAGINTWPPFFSLLCVPLALLARPTPYLARVCWLLLNFVLLWGVLRMLARLVYGADLRFLPRATNWSLATPEILLPVVLCYRFILGNFDHLQVNIVIFACALAGVYWHTRGHDLRGGMALGVAAALKVMPVVFVPYFLYRRRYRMALATATATAAFSLSPVLVYGWPRFAEYVYAWRREVQHGWGVGKMNQSVFAMVDRYVGHGFTPFNAPVENLIPESGSPLVMAITMAALLAITVLGLWLFRGRAAADSPSSLVEYSVVFVVSALFGPLTWKAYLVVLLLPCTVLVRLLRRGELSPLERRVVLAALGGYAVLCDLTTPGLLGQRLAGTLEMLSTTTVGALLILATLLWLRPRLNDAPARVASRV